MKNKIHRATLHPTDRRVLRAEDIGETQGHAPNCPMTGSLTLAASKLYEMPPARAGETSEGRNAADNQTVRTVYIIVPDRKIKLTLADQVTAGRNFDGVLRALESLRLPANHPVATSVHRKRGNDVITAGSASNGHAEKIHCDGWKELKPYVHIVPQPV